MDEFLVPTGAIIKDYLEAREISQRELSQRIGVSEKHISNLLNGKSALTAPMALKLEKLMPDVDAGYWLNYEAKYQEYLARIKEQEWLEGLNLKEIAERFHFKEVFPKTKLTLAEQAAEMLKLLKITSFDDFRPGSTNKAIEYMQDNGEAEAVTIWLNLCEEEIEEQNTPLAKSYSAKTFEENLLALKYIALNPDLNASLKSCRKLLNSNGVYFVVQQAIINSKVRGALTTYDAHPAIYISGRFKSHDHIWFAIFHEVAHLLLHYDPDNDVISYDELSSEPRKDKEANEYARKMLLDINTYNELKKDNKPTESAIINFAAEQDVTPGIVVGFLQHDEILEYSEMNYLKS